MPDQENRPSGDSSTHLRPPTRTVAVLAATFLLPLTLLSLWLSGCQNLNLPNLGASPTPSQPATRPTQPPTATPIPPTPTVPSSVTLTLWTAPDFSPEAKGPAGEEMRRLLNTFNETSPDIQLEYVLKKPQGKGGLLDLLLTASSVAPGILPDLVFLEPHALRDAARGGYVQPLDDLLPPSLQEDLFPFALKAGRFDGRLQGLQFQTDALHLLYNTNKVETPPLAWADVLTGTEAGYLFPAGGQSGLAADSTLVHYLGAGATLLDELGQLTLDQAALTAVLAYYQAGLQSGVVPTTALELGSTIEVWPSYLAAEIAMTEVAASEYLKNRHLLRNSHYAAIPGLDGPAPTVSQGWMVAIVTHEPHRMAAAARFLEWWLSSENNASWNLAAGTLPVRRSAHQRLSKDDPYFGFLADLLETAHPYPLTPTYREAAAAWQIAIKVVLVDGQPPQEAAAQVMDTLGQ
jgi:ABC-type glycerol-3-phosphate transport system substrate-binding protein